MRMGIRVIPGPHCESDPERDEAQFVDKLSRGLARKSLDRSIRGIPALCVCPGVPDEERCTLLPAGPFRPYT